jgi:hypothetical protein
MMLGGWSVVGKEKRREENAEVLRKGRRGRHAFLRMKRATQVIAGLYEHMMSHCMEIAQKTYIVHAEVVYK